MYKQVIVCDSCGTFTEADPDSGAPIGWLILARMVGHPGCWDDANEWNFCSRECVEVPDEGGLRRREAGAVADKREQLRYTSLRWWRGLFHRRSVRP